MTSKLSIIQFPHSGKEPYLTQQSGVIPWNQKQHCRKFLKAQGRVVTGSGLSNLTDVYFWGEWEPESRYTRLPGSSVPRYVHERKLPVKQFSSGASSKCGNVGCQNTDPYVFGDYFIYSLCRQQMRNFTVQRQTACLNIGSLILFGSCVQVGGSPAFALDTVFVVDESRSYTPMTYKSDLAGFIPPEYPRIMLYNTWKTPAHFTCYHGATFYKPRNGMYSFVPCKIGQDGANGFVQPILRNADFAVLGYTQDVLRDNCSRNFYCSLGPKKLAMSDVKNVWDQVRKLIANQGYLEGIDLR